jgi:hypothetical protein
VLSEYDRYTVIVHLPWWGVSELSRRVNLSSRSKATPSSSSRLSAYAYGPTEPPQGSKISVKSDEPLWRVRVAVLASKLVEVLRCAPLGLEGAQLTHPSLIGSNGLAAGEVDVPCAGSLTISGSGRVIRVFDNCKLLDFHRKRALVLATPFGET